MSLAAPLQGPVSLNLPFATQSAGEVRRTLVSWLRHHGSPQSVIDDARLVATELVANAIRHAGPLNDQTLLVRWQPCGTELVLSVYDGGGRARPRQIEAPADAESGRGLAIVDALSLKWWVERERDVTVVHVHLPLG